MINYACQNEGSHNNNNNDNNNFLPFHSGGWKYPLKLLQYTISESPEYKEVGPFFEGKFPETTGRTVFTLFEIYETADGLHHHWIESAPWADTFTEVIDAHKIELQMFNQMKVIQSLWD